MWTLLSNNPLPESVCEGCGREVACSSSFPRDVEGFLKRRDLELCDNSCPGKSGCGLATREVVWAQLGRGALERDTYHLTIFPSAFFSGRNFSSPFSFTSVLAFLTVLMAAPVA